MVGMQREIPYPCLVTLTITFCNAYPNSIRFNLAALILRTSVTSYENTVSKSRTLLTVQ